MQAKVLVKGIVQGVGFRPFVYRTATRYRLVGFVRNRADAVVEILVQGSNKPLEEFLEALKQEKPPMARIEDLSVEFLQLDDAQLRTFQIASSGHERKEIGSTIPPDIATCDNCLAELQDPKDRRHEYFFITCTDCGPRFSVIERLPYDRPNTSMTDFEMCRQCDAEYRNPTNRRFHAQTVACSQCGPKVFLRRSDGGAVETDDPIRES